MCVASPILPGSARHYSRATATATSEAAGNVACSELWQFQNVDSTTPVESVSTASGTLTDPALPSVTTTVPNSLAVCIQVYSYNIAGGEEPVPSGASGGAWTMVACMAA
jgi:hypothetical protein